MGTRFLNGEVSEIGGSLAVESEGAPAVQGCGTCFFCASIFSGRFPHFSRTELGVSFRFRFFSMSETLESGIAPRPSISVPLEPGSGADNLLLLLCSDRNFFTYKDRENLLGVGVGEPVYTLGRRLLAHKLLSGNQE